MRRLLLALTVLLALPAISQAQRPAPPAWQTKVNEQLPLLGHRNCILIVDSAYPLQASPGVETIDTGSDQLEVVRYVLGAINRSIHVRPDITMDAELPFVSDDEAPGASRYRHEIADLLRPYPIQSQPHLKIISTIDETSKQFQVLVLKTTLAIPYTSVFIRLDCKYWPADAESRLRAKIAASQPAQ